MNKILYPLHPCPWCKALPSVKFDFDSQTWMPTIVCKNSLCPVNPTSKPQNIRKTCKTDLNRLKIKMGDLFDEWNKGNPIAVTHGKQIDFDKIIAQGVKEEEERITRK